MTTTKCECDRCGCEVDENDSLWAEGFKNVCNDCYYEIVKTCQLCGDDDVMPSAVSEFIVVKTELGATANRLPGIYRVTRRPFLSIPLIGGGSLHGGDVAFVDRLPKPDGQFEISGHVCKKCAAPYARQYRCTYGRVQKGMREVQGKWIDPMFERERKRVAEVARAHPEMLRDLEEDDAYSLERLSKVWDLPADAKTWNEWLLLEHRGVKIFKIYQGDKFGDSWLTLRPEPKYRNDRCSERGVVFCASSLPTYPQYPDRFFGWSGYVAPKGYMSTYDWTRKHAIPAIKAAIERGFLTQSGGRDAVGNPVEFR